MTDSPSHSIAWRWALATANLSLFVLLCAPSCQSAPKNSFCTVRAAALDIGSGSTKYAVFEQNLCEGTTLEVTSGQIEIGFSRDLESAVSVNALKFSSTFLAGLERKIELIASELRNLQVTEISGFATAAFRKAQNANEALAIIENTLSRSGGRSVSFRVISQRDEAELGLRSAIWTSGNPSGVVWDIGGGSSQISRLSPSGETQFWGAPFGSQVFLSQVRSRYRLRHGTAIPVHLGPEGVQLAFEIGLLAAQKSKRDIAKVVQVGGPTTQSTWLGIGGVWNHSVKRQLEFCGFKDITVVSLQSCIQRQSQLDLFRPSHPDFTDTEVTNLILAASWMQELRVQRVEPISNSLLNYWIRFCHAGKVNRGDQCPIQLLETPIKTKSAS